MKLRIVNKNKDGCILENGGNLFKYTWNQFNSMFDIDQKNSKYAVLKTDCGNSFDKTKELTEKLVEKCMTLGGSEDKLAKGGMFGNELKELAKVMNISEDEAVEYIRYAYNSATNKKSDKKDKKPKTTYVRNKKPTTKVAKEFKSYELCSIGDILKAKGCAV